MGITAWTKERTRRMVGAALLALTLGALGGAAGVDEASATSRPYIPMCQYWVEECD